MCSGRARPASAASFSSPGPAVWQLSTAGLSPPAHPRPVVQHSRVSDRVTSYPPFWTASVSIAPSRPERRPLAECLVGSCTHRWRTGRHLRVAEGECTATCSRTDEQRAQDSLAGSSGPGAAASRTLPSLKRSNVHRSSKSRAVQSSEPGVCLSVCSGGSGGEESQERREAGEEGKLGGGSRGRAEPVGMSWPDRVVAAGRVSRTRWWWWGASGRKSGSALERGTVEEGDSGDSRGGVEGGAPGDGGGAGWREEMAEGIQGPERREDDGGAAEGGYRDDGEGGVRGRRALLSRSRR